MKRTLFSILWLATMFCFSFGLGRILRVLHDSGFRHLVGI